MRNFYAISILAACCMISCMDRNISGSRADLTDTLHGILIVEQPTVQINVVIEKQLTYDLYTLADTFPYRDTVRIFQWEKIHAALTMLDSMLVQTQEWGIMQNRHNQNGRPAMVRNYKINAYNAIADIYGVERSRAIPLHYNVDSLIPERYGLDGSLVRLLPSSGDSIVNIEPVFIGGTWVTPAKYIKKIDMDSLRFDHTIFVDRTNQCITTLERSNEGKWLIRSMNPATTGVHRPPYQQETPLGVFVIQEKKSKMVFLVDGTTDEKGGFAPFANRFCNGGYVHGVPVNEPRTDIVEYSYTLGTTPRSHMCVRTATSHAKFVYDTFPTEHTVVFVIE